MMNTLVDSRVDNMIFLYIPLYVILMILIKFIRLKATKK